MYRIHTGRMLFQKKKIKGEEEGEEANKKAGDGENWHIVSEEPRMRMFQEV